MGESAKEIAEVIWNTEASYKAALESLAANETIMLQNRLSPKTIRKQAVAADKYFRATELLIRKLKAAHKVAVRYNL